MRYALAVLAIAGSVGAASAQEVPEITVTPRGGGAIGTPGYVGPYGSDLPGVSLFAGRAVPVSPSFADGEVKLPSNRKLANSYTYQDPLPVLDGWQGTLGDGFPF